MVYNKEWKIREGDTMKKADIILVVIILIIGCSALMYINMNKEEGTMVVVTVGGEVIETLSIEKDQTIEIQGPVATNVLQIKDGYADIIDATCNDEVCVHSRKIKNNNETIICLPNELIVKVQSNVTDNNSVIDGVAN